MGADDFLDDARTPPRPGQIGRRLANRAADEFGDVHTCAPKATHDLLVLGTESDVQQHALSVKTGLSLHKSLQGSLHVHLVEVRAEAEAQAIIARVGHHVPLEQRR